MHSQSGARALDLAIELGLVEVVSMIKVRAHCDIIAKSLIE
jgi:hypothetical protein